MTKEPMTLAAFRAILEDVLDEENVVITEATVAKQVPAWDSLNHVRLLVGIEQAYGISFPVDSIEQLENVGALIELVNRLQAERANR